MGCLNPHFKQMFHFTILYDFRVFFIAIFCIIVSLIAMAFTISTSDLFEGASTISKFLIFLFGLLTVASRLLVCCLYSMIDKTLGVVPVGTAFAASLIAWYILRSSRYSIYFECQNNRGSGSVVFYCLLSTIYNCFTSFGLLMSTLNLLFVKLGLNV